MPVEDKGPEAAVSIVHFDSAMTDDERRGRLYDGEIFLYSPTDATRALCAFACDMVEAAFAPHDPRRAHEVLPVRRCVEILAALKPSFIHHPQSKALLQRILAESGCDLDDTYFDVPRLRSAMPQDYLASGIAYAFHPHRDTWYSAPQCQLNWWLPIYDMTAENCMAFHPRYWREGVRNSSAGYNYARWNAESRKTAAQHVERDTRVQPHAEEPMALDPDLRLLCPPGGVILFSAAQMHSTVPNTASLARFSIDFRTVSLADARARRGAPNVDAASTGTTMGDYLRVRDLMHLPDAVIARYDRDDRAGDEAMGNVTSVG
jgi:hypothetical protein